MKQSAVITELKTTATESQQHVKEFLEAEKKEGTVKDYHSYFIVNGMAVTAKKEIAEKIATFTEVEKNITKRKTRTSCCKEDKRKKTPKSKLQNVEWNVERVKAPDTWSMGIDGTGTVVASLDTGAQWDHPALKEKYRGFDAAAGEVDHQFSFYDATAAGQKEAYDDQGHGTHVTGTMVGSEPDGKNQIGVAPGAEWISVRVFDSSGSTTDAILLDGAEWILAPGGRVDLAPDVVNNSWGGGPGLDEWYRDAVRAWRANDIFPEFSAGNTTLFNPGGPESIAVPANYPESFATGATDIDDMIAEFSLRGPSPYGEVKPDISAPGVNIRSSVPGSGYEGGWNGTSMSGPAVSAVAALLRQVNANISVGDMEEILINTATPRTDSEYSDVPNNGYGHGVVNAFEAVSSIMDGLGTIEGTVMVEGEETKVPEQSNKDKEKKKKKAKKDDKKKRKNSLPAFKNKEKGAKPTLLPLGAKVSVLESGRTVNADPDDGTFAFTHAAGKFTVMADAYGYQSEQESVEVVADESTSVNFVLEELAKSTLSGSVTDQATGNPVKDATILLVEDANIEPIQSNEDGTFSLTAYNGTYTLKIAATGYHTQEVEVSLNKDQNLNIDLEPFYTYPGGEIGYDDGTPENARAFYDAGNKWAVKMSLPEGKDTAIVTDGVFRFWDTEWPSPGGTEFAVEVWDASGQDGLPGEKLAGPIDAEALRNGEWTVVDLSEHNITVDGDFYMVYKQTKDNPYTPGLATDESSPNAERSYQFAGSWSQSPADEGNYMIRARVSYEIENPVITTPEESFITNEAEQTIKGTASPTTTIQLLNNGEEVDTQEVDDKGKFQFDVELTEGENEFKAVSLKNEGKTGESEAIVVTLDTQQPELSIDSPRDGDKTNRETVTVEGVVADDYLDTVEVNGQKANVKDGKYSKRILLDNGESVIEVVATDLAGNTTEKSVTIDVNFNGVELEGLTPNEDVHLETGESVKVEFTSEPGLKTSFAIHMPLTNTKHQLSNTTELPIMEVSPGKYVGYWTVPKKAYADGAELEVTVKDGYGNVTKEKAAGKLFINIEE